MGTRASRRKHRAGGTGRSGASGRTYARMPVEMLVDTVVASAADRQGRPGAPADHLLDALAGRGAAGLEALATALLAGVGTAWERHWQPADVVRAAGRLCGGTHADLVAEAVSRQLDTYPDGALPPRWLAQLDGLGPAASGWRGDDWLLRGTTPDGVGFDPPGVESGVLATAVEAVALLRCLPELPAIGPRPGEVAYPTARDGTGAAPTGEVDPGVLHRVASLLAKAESTAFPEEAEALTGKAQQLMARHAIDRALVEASRRQDGDRQGAAARRLGVDDPYAGAKAMLLQQIASANRCRSVWTRTFGFATVFGSDTDLDTVELLYTSLLVQSARAMLNASPPGGGRAATTRQFRQSFLVSFAHRIGDRLAEAVQSAVDEAADATGQGRAGVLPVLAGREDAAEQACEEAYPDVRTARTSANDPAGWQAGRQAADRAHLDLQDTIGSGHEHVLGAGLREGRAGAG